MSQPDMSDAAILASAREAIAREADAVAALAEQMGSRFCEVARMLLACEGHVLVTGAGTSASVARRFAHLLSCAGIPGIYVDAGECLHGGSGTITARDILYVISKGGRSAEVNQVAEIALERGARVIAQTEDPESPLATASCAVLDIKAPRAVDLFDGLMAVGSSLVACATGDALCAALLVMRGYTLEEFARTHPGGAVGETIRHRLESRGEEARAQ